MKKYLIVFISLFLFLSINAQEKYLMTGSKFFQWYLIKYDNGIDGAQDKSGKDIISSNRRYCDIVFHDEEDKFGYFTVKYGNLMGVCDMDGTEIVPCKYSNIIYHPYDRVLMYENYDGKYISLNISLENNANANFNLPRANKSLITSNPTSHNNGTSQATKKVAVASYSTKTSSSTSQKTRSNNSTSTKSVNRKSSYSPSSLSYKTWETKWEKGHTEFVRSADGMVDETMYMNCVCLGGTCKICAGLGVTGYGMFQTYCNSCGGSGRCSFCDGTGTKVTTKRYRFIDEYYSNGGVALHVTSSSGGPSVYMGGVGSVYYTYGNSKPIADEGSYYSFGGETVYGVKTNSFRLSKDYKTLWMGNQEYHLVDKAEYDRLAEVSSKIRSGVAPVSSGSSGSAGYSGGSSGSNGSRNSVYTKCTDCNGTGRCRHCSGRGTSILSGHTETCVVCNGSGRCKICYGRGKL